MTLEEELRCLASELSSRLARQFEARAAEMASDDRSHAVLYGALGVDAEEGRLIDLYQNRGRFLYRYVGDFVEVATRRCLQHRHPGAGPGSVPNALAKSPRQYKIDCLLGTEAIEVKWRDATTDGDHVRKERARVLSIHAAGLQPVRLMFFRPNRSQAAQIQGRLETLYREVGGAYYAEDAAWRFVRERSGFDLKEFVHRLARSHTHEQ